MVWQLKSEKPSEAQMVLSFAKSVTFLHAPTRLPTTATLEPQKGQAPSPIPTVYTPLPLISHWLECGHIFTSSFKRGWEIQSFPGKPHTQLKNSMIMGEEEMDLQGSFPAGACQCPLPDAFWSHISESCLLPGRPAWPRLQ